MGKVEKISVALTDEMLATVRSAVASGDYASTSEVLREALRAWKARRSTEADAVAELRRLIAEADASGVEPWEGAEAIRAEGRRRLAALRK